MTLKTKPAKQTKASYAETRNQMFEKTEENTVISVRSRFDDVVALSKRNKRLGASIQDALFEFEDRYPHLLTWDAFKEELPEAIELTLNLIWVNKTLQRIPSLEAIERYILNYRGIKVQPIKVYLDPNTGKYVCWDGQHTVIMLYMILTEVLKLNPADVKIPVIINKSNDIAEMRDALMSENGEGRTLFDSVDMFEQAIYAVRHDGDDENEDFAVANYKQECLEDNGLFLANPRRNEGKEAGALTRTNEILDPKYHHTATLAFAQYAKYVNGASRPFDGSEVDCMYYFFQRCIESGMDLDARYVRSVAKVCQKVQGDDFDGTDFWTRVKLSYRNWFNKMQENKPLEEQSRISEGGDKNEKMLTFLCTMLERDDVETPEYTAYWPVSRKDLF